MQNFGKIKNAFNGLLVESFVGDKESNKNLFKTYIKTIRENEALKTQFLVYNNIENKIEENEFKANLFLQENIALLNKFSKKDLLEANQKLAKAISVEDETYEKQELHENLSELIFLKKSSKNIDAIVEATSKIIIHMKNNKLKLVKEAIELPNSMLSTIMVEKYNERYSTLDENEKEMLKNSWENPALLPFDDAMKYLENYYMPQIANYERVGMINSAYGLAYYFFSMASVHLGFEGKCKILWDMSSRGFKYCKLFDPKKDIPKEFR